ncbi:hypothetical protein KUCAC02_032802, partial [Chaenocephalus aceratus]
SESFLRRKVELNAGETSGQPRLRTAAASSSRGGVHVVFRGFGRCLQRLNPGMTDRGRGNSCCRLSGSRLMNCLSWMMALLL